MPKANNSSNNTNRGQRERLLQRILDKRLPEGTYPASSVLKCARFAERPSDARRISGSHCVTAKLEGANWRESRFGVAFSKPSTEMLAPDSEIRRQNTEAPEKFLPRGESWAGGDQGE